MTISKVAVKVLYVTANIHCCVCDISTDTVAFVFMHFIITDIDNIYAIYAIYIYSINIIYIFN